MKVTELMIGDWVRINRDGLCIKKGTIVEVRGIDGDNKFPEKDLHGVADCRPLDKSQFQGGIWCEYLDPIPLTPEILEKNGFDLNGIPTEMVPVEERDYSDDTYVWQERDELGNLFTVSLYDQNDGLGTWSCEVVDCPKGSMEIIIKSVHELQHVLRLCGIEKEIIL